MHNIFTTYNEQMHNIFTKYNQKCTIYLQHISKKCTIYLQNTTNKCTIYLQHITNKCKICLILIVVKKTPTCFDASVYHLQESFFYTKVTCHLKCSVLVHTLKVLNKTSALMHRNM